MCTNQIRYRGQTLSCGATLTRMDTNGVVRRETVHCFECVKEAALRWSMAKCEAYLDEFWDHDEHVDLPDFQAA
ncbi:MAG: hypothetical protein EA399_00690 [Desulfovibrionales bacterium]|nr:MAG: hypothetical protein EA399_00690 [Desulfovibrionales bacterium]